jgi:hypothetical protein
MIKQSLTALALSGAVLTAHAGAILQENFDNMAGLTASGWVINNASSPMGITGGWYQGDQTTFSAQNGAPESYAAANYNNAASGGVLDSWLITPEFSTAHDVSVSLWLRGDAFPGFSDLISFGFSDGSIATALFTMNPTFTAPTDGWTMYTLNLGAQGAGTTGRFAVRYSGMADASNYVGVDNLTVTVPEPSTILILAAGLMALTMARRRQRP